MRKIYFAFHYQKDIDRVNEVLTSEIVRKKYAIAGLYGAPVWEKAKKAGNQSVMLMILDGLQGTSVTVFLLGEETANRKWVQYELEESWKRGNGIVGIYIHQLRDADFKRSSKGPGILEGFTYEVNGKECSLGQWFKTYDWVENDGPKNFGSWVEESVTTVERLKDDGTIDL